MKKYNMVMNVNYVGVPQKRSLTIATLNVPLVDGGVRLLGLRTSEVTQEEGGEGKKQMTKKE